MDQNLVYVKTPIGDEAVRQSTRVVQRNLRMVLVQVDGKTNVEELIGKIGNPRLVEAALSELEDGGYIAPTIEAVSVWEESKRVASLEAMQQSEDQQSQFSTFGEKASTETDLMHPVMAASSFSTFGKPILPASSTLSADRGEPPRHVGVGPDFNEWSQRSGVSFRRLIFPALIILLVGLTAAAIFFPYDRFKPDVEAAATRFLAAPVRVSRLGFGLWPVPSFYLSGVSIGEPVDGTIAEVRISSPWDLFGQGPHHISRVEISGAMVAANRLVSLPMFNGNAEALNIVIHQVRIENSQLVFGEGLLTSKFDGDLMFAIDGTVKTARFEAIDRSFLVNAKPSGHAVALTIEERAWSPLGSKVTFAALQAKALLQGYRLDVQDIDTTFLGGILRGNWLLDWHEGLSMTGQASLSRLDVQKMSLALAPSLKIDGELSGSVRMRSNGNNWDELWRNVDAVLETEITRGVIYGIDLGEAARRSGQAEVRGGATRFDRLNATVTIAPNLIASRNVRVDAGMMTARGHFSCSRNAEVDGAATVILQTSVSSISVPISINGMLPNLNVQTRK